MDGVQLRLALHRFPVLDFIPGAPAAGTDFVLELAQGDARALDLFSQFHFPLEYTKGLTVLQCGRRCRPGIVDGSIDTEIDRRKKARILPDAGCPRLPLLRLLQLLQLLLYCFCCFCCVCYFLKRPSAFPEYQSFKQTTEGKYPDSGRS